MMTKTIVIAVDNSTACLKAVDYVKDHFPIGYRYNLVHVLHRPLLGRSPSPEKIAETEEFMNNIFMPAAISAAEPVEVFSTMLECEPDGKFAVGRAICEYLDKIPADSVVLMKKHRSIVEKVFQGSVTAYCAAHSHVTVIIVAP
ncbi:g9433 [Coccomyxa elongata]